MRVSNFMTKIVKLCPAGAFRAIGPKNCQSKETANQLYFSSQLCSTSLFHNWYEQTSITVKHTRTGFSSNMRYIVTGMNKKPVIDAQQLDA